MYSAHLRTTRQSGYYWRQQDTFFLQCAVMCWKKLPPPQCIPGVVLWGRSWCGCDPKQLWATSQCLEMYQAKTTLRTFMEVYVVICAVYSWKLLLDWVWQVLTSFTLRMLGSQPCTKALASCQSGSAWWKWRKLCFSQSCCSLNRSSKASKRHIWGIWRSH